jgi:hypothetical protein
MAFVGLLLSAGADPSPADNEGLTPLHNAAAKFDGRKAVEALFAAGADPTALGTATWGPAARERGRVTPADIAFLPDTRRLLERAQLAVRLAPLMAAAGRGRLFDARLFDAAVWRVVGHFVDASFGGRGRGAGA